MADERHEWFLNQIFRHWTALHRYLGKFTSGAEDIEDLVQETYGRINQGVHFPSFDDMRSGSRSFRRHFSPRTS